MGSYVLYKGMNACKTLVEKCELNQKIFLLKLLQTFISKQVGEDSRLTYNYKKLEVMKQIYPIHNLSGLHQNKLADFQLNMLFEEMYSFHNMK